MANSRQVGNSRWGRVAGPVVVGVTKLVCAAHPVAPVRTTAMVAGRSVLLRQVIADPAMLTLASAGPASGPTPS